MYFYLRYHAVELIHLNTLRLNTQYTVSLRDGPLEKLWGGGGEFSSRRNFFSLSNSLYEFF